MSKFFLFGTALILSGFFFTGCKENTRLFVGGFTKTGTKGFSVFDFNRRDRNLKLITESDAGPDPSYFCISKRYGYIYAANEVMNFNGVKGGGVTTLSYDK